MSITYTTRGSVRGACGHKHRSIGAALACANRGQRACARQGGYSDRDVTRSDGEPLTEREHETVIDAQDSLSC